MARSIRHRECVDFDQVTRSKRRYAEHHVRRLVIAEQLDAGLFDDRQAFVPFIIDDVDCDPGDLCRERTGHSSVHGQKL